MHSKKELDLSQSSVARLVQTTSMDEVKDLFNLPEEIVIIILKKLSIPDLISCSKVSKSWRMGINLDTIWKKFCFQESYDDELIHKTHSHLFIDCFIPEDVCLEPLCHWREVYGWYKRLSKNWTERNYQKYQLSQTASPVHSLDCDSQTVVTGHEDSTISVWSVENLPYHLQTIVAVLTDYPILSVKTNSRYIIALQKKLLHVYEKKDVYVLKDIKSFELGDDNIDQMNKYVDLGSNYVSWYKESLRLHELSIVTAPLIFNLFQDRLFASRSGSDIVHIWNLSNDFEVLVKEGLSELSQIECVNSSVYFVLHILNGSTISEYNVEKDTIKFMIIVPGFKKFIIGSKLVLSIPSPGDSFIKRITVWRKGQYTEPIGTKTISSSHFSAVIAHNSYVIYSENYYVKVWDVLLNANLFTFSVGSTIGFIKSGFDESLIVFMNSSLHLWNWKTGKRLYRLYTALEWTGDYRHLVWVDSSMLLSAGVNHQLEMISFL